MKIPLSELGKMEPDKSGAGGSTQLTKIGGAPSLDEQFGNGRNPFNVSMTELDRQIKSKGGRL